MYLGWCTVVSCGALAQGGGASFEVKLSVHVGGSPGLADLALARRAIRYHHAVLRVAGCPEERQS